MKGLSPSSFPLKLLSRTGHSNALQNLHIERILEEEKSFKCVICDTRFPKNHKSNLP